MILGERPRVEVKVYLQTTGSNPPQINSFYARQAHMLGRGQSELLFVLDTFRL